MMNRTLLKWVTGGGAIAIAIAFSVPVLTTAISKDGRSGWVRSSGDDMALLIAENKARASYAHFKEIFERPDRNQSEFQVEVVFPAASGIPQAVWLDELLLKDNYIEGRIASESYAPLKSGLVEGQRTSAPTHKLIDWMYLEDDRFRGAFTARVFAERALETERAAILENLHEEPLP